MKNRKIKIRSAAISRVKNKILLHKKTGDIFWNAPGGKVENHETAEQCIIREMKEELQWNVKEISYLGILENFFQLNDKVYKEIIFYFEINAIEGKIHDEITVRENNAEYVFKYFTKDEIEKIVIKPNIFKSILYRKSYPFYLTNVD